MKPQTVHVRCQVHWHANCITHLANQFHHSQEFTMATLTHAAMHRDHCQWLSDNDMWRCDIASWQRELRQAAADLEKIAEAFKDHERALQVHAAAIRLREQDLDAHEHALAEYERGETAAELIPLAQGHENEALKHKQQIDAHERSKLRHNKILAPLGKLQRPVKQPQYRFRSRLSIRPLPTIRRGRRFHFDQTAHLGEFAPQAHQHIVKRYQADECAILVHNRQPPKRSSAHQPQRRRQRSVTLGHNDVASHHLADGRRIGIARIGQSANHQVAIRDDARGTVCLVHDNQ
jgi:hypothetical protein